MVRWQAVKISREWNATLNCETPLARRSNSWPFTVIAAAETAVPVTSNILPPEIEVYWFSVFAE